MKLTKNEREFLNFFLEHIDEELGMGLDTDFVEEFEDRKFPKKWIRKDDGCVDVDKIWQHLRKKITA
jgi:hypothetical protein